MRLTVLELLFGLHEQGLGVLTLLFRLTFELKIFYLQLVDLIPHLVDFRCLATQLLKHLLIFRMGLFKLLPYLHMGISLKCDHAL
jgi:hypothetical protein